MIARDFHDGFTNHDDFVIVGHVDNNETAGNFGKMGNSVTSQ